MTRTILLLVLLAAVQGSLFADIALKITEPASGTVVHPGQTVEVTVSVSGGPISSLGLLVKWHINGSAVVSGPPYKFSFTLPSSNIIPGLDTIGAVASTPSGPVFAQASVDIERPDVPESISLNYSQLKLRVDSDVPLAVYGKYGDSSILDLTRSTQTKYESTKAYVVSVASDGQVTALAPGSAAIVVSHQRLRAMVSVTVTDTQQ